MVASSAELWWSLLASLLAVGYWSSIQPTLHAPSGLDIDTIPHLTADGLWRGFAQRDSTALMASELGVLSGRHALVTGTTKGLGYALVVRLVSLGVRVISASRGYSSDFTMQVLQDAAALAISEGRELPANCTSELITLHKLDLADLDSIESLARTLKGTGTVVDLAILNAGVSPAGTELTRHGLELAFGVNFVGNAALIQSLLRHGVISPVKKLGGLFDKVLGATASANAGKDSKIIFVASESHRSVVPLNVSGILDGIPRQFGVTEGMKWYGNSKLCLLTYASELARVLAGRAVVETICPGPVKSNIAHRAPWWARPFAHLYMAPFPDPMHAAIPVLALAARPTPEERVDFARHYLMAAELPSRADARDPTMGKLVYDRAHRIIEARGPLAGAE